MSGEVVIDEFQLTFVTMVPLTEDEVRAIRRTLARPKFRHRLRRAIEGVAERRPELVKLAVRISQ